MSVNRNERHLTFFTVGNGNTALVSLSSDLNLMFDLNETEDYFSVLSFLKNILPKRHGKPYLAVFCVSHGDQDHIQGTEKLLKDFLVGEIWYPNYDRFQMEGEEQTEDYEALHTEIDRRRQAMAHGSAGPGDLAYDLTAMDERQVICGLLVEDFTIRVLSPYRKDEGEEGFDVNDMSLVLNVEVSGMRWLFGGDASSKIWLERVNTHLLSKDEFRDWAKADILIAAHHGSYTFFDKDRESARDNPANLSSLTEKIKPKRIVVSSKERFPLKDQQQEPPPHYAAYKWYRKYLVDNKLCDQREEHPFLYACDGNVRFELREGKWVVQEHWEPPNGGDKGGGTPKVAFTPAVGVGEHAPRKFA